MRLGQERKYGLGEDGRTVKQSGKNEGNKKGSSLILSVVDPIAQTPAANKNLSSTAILSTKETKL